MAEKKLPKVCPVCGVEGTIRKEGRYFHCTDAGCGVSFPGKYLGEKAAAEKKAAESKAQG